MKKPIFALLIAATALAPIAAEAQDRQGRGDGRGRQWNQQAPDGASRQQPRPDYSGARRGTPEAYARPQQLQATPAPQARQPQASPQPRPQWQGGDRSQWQRGDRPQFRPAPQADAPRQPQAPLQAQQASPQPRPQWQGRDRPQWQRGDRPQFRPAPQADAPRQPQATLQGQRDRDRRWGDRDRQRDQQVRRGTPAWNAQQAQRREGQWNREGRRYGDWRDNDRYRSDLNDRRSWSRDWRRDNRYDWSRYRRSNRHVYHLPRYYAPHGWDYGYRRFSIGITLGAMLFGPDYWISDPWYYRLPPAYGPYRWVRYYNDALLVDLRTGLVVDVIYDIFW